MKNNFKANANSYLRVYNDNACSTTDADNSAKNSHTNRVRTIIGKAEAAKFQEEISTNIKLYPVPVKGDLKVILTLGETSKYEMMIGTVSGNAVRQFEGRLFYKGTNSLSIDISSLTAGMYYLKVSNGRNSIVRKFLKIE